MEQNKRRLFSVLLAGILVFLSGVIFLALQLWESFSDNRTLALPSVVPTPFSEEIKASLKIEKPADLEEVTVTKIIDGDTIVVSGDRTVRYIGINTPETNHPRLGKECYGESAKEANRLLLEGKTVFLEKDVSNTDRYDRLLRYIYLEDFMVNEYLVLQGFALSSTYPPDVKYQDRLREAQIEAMTKERGLWKECLVSDDGEDILGYSTDEYEPNRSLFPSIGASPVRAPVVNRTSNPGIAPNESQSTMVPTTLPSSTVLQENIDYQPSPTILPTIVAQKCTIKGNISGSEKIYHVEGCDSYNRTGIDESSGEKWFCNENEAVAAGWRKAKNCPSSMHINIHDNLV